MEHELGREGIQICGGIGVSRKKLRKIMKIIVFLI